METLTLLREFGKYLTFRRKRILLMSIIILSVLPGTLIFSLPWAARIIYAAVFLVLAMVPIFSTVQLTLGPAIQVAQVWLYNRKHKSAELVYSGIKPREIKRMSKKIGLGYNKALYVTDNPLVTSPFVNLLTRKITIPLSWPAKFDSTEIKAAVGHELGHIKWQNKFMREMFLAMLAPVIFILTFAVSTLRLGLFTIPIFCQIAALAFMLLILSFVLWRNEYRADWTGAMIAGPEPLISVFQALQEDGKKDEGSDTHPPLHARIKRLYNLLDE